MSVALSLFLVMLFLAMNAFFVVAEFACVRVRKSQIDLAYEQKKRGSKHAKAVSENINAYLSACQLGITLASLALGWLGEPAFAHLLRPVVDLTGISPAASAAIGTALGFIIMTSLHVVVGELIPKSFAIFSTEKYALRTSGPLLWFYRITYPIMWLFNTITNAVCRLAGHDPADEREVYTDDEIKLLIDESTESGLIGKHENEYVDNIFDLGEKDAEAIMTPRTDLICLDLEDSLADNMSLIRQYKYTRYPVCRGDKDHLEGFVHVKDLYLLPESATVDDLKIRTLVAVPEGIPLAKLLQVLQAEHTKICVVVDEHGGTSGIVTMSDIMEQIIGRIDDEYQHSGEEEDARLQPDGSYLLEGSMPIADLEELMGFEPEENYEFETAGGLLLSLFDRIPEEGDEVLLEHGDATVSFAVVAMDRLRIDTIRMRLRKEDQAS